jgi:hypothetical protein
MPLEQAINKIVSGSKKCLICVTYNPDFISEDPNYNKFEVLFTSTHKSEVIRQLRKSINYANHYGDRCQNDDIPKFEDLNEEESDSYTVFIRYKN